MVVGQKKIGRMKDQVSQEVKEQRVDALMATQQEAAFALADRRIGSTFDVLVDDVSEDGTLVARHEGQAPSVDSVTLVGGARANPGEVLSVRCAGREGYDLVAHPEDVALPVLVDAPITHS